jgi:hypothetical protein
MVDAQHTRATDGGGADELGATTGEVQQSMLARHHTLDRLTTGMVYLLVQEWHAVAQDIADPRPMSDEECCPCTESMVSIEH